MTYENFVGIDASANENGKNKKNHPVYCVNMYRDYKNCDRSEDYGCALETVPGYRRIANFTDNIFGIHGFKDYIIVHHGEDLSAFLKDCRDSLDTPGNMISLFSEMAETKSTSFVHSGALYILDGEHFLKVTQSGLTLVCSEAKSSPYIPTVFENGVKVRQANILTDRYCEAFENCGTEYHNDFNLSYVEYDTVNHYASVTGVNPLISRVYVPSTVMIGDTLCTVRRISSGAFSYSKIKTAVISRSVAVIESMAFRQCENLSLVALHPYECEIGENAFKDCRDLKKLWLHYSYATDDNAFSGCDGIEELYLLEGSIESGNQPSAQITFFNCRLIDANVGETVQSNISCESFPNTFLQSEYTEGVISKPFENDGKYYTKALSKTLFATQGFRNNSQYRYIGYTLHDENGCVIENDSVGSYKFSLSSPGIVLQNGIYANGCVVSHSPATNSLSALGERINYSLDKNGSLTKSVIITSDKSLIDSLKIKVMLCGAQENISAYSSLTSASGYMGNIIDALCKCRIGCAFDGRIFLSGNPALPGVVFFSSEGNDSIARDDYFGEDSFVLTGTGGYCCKAMIASPSCLSIIEESKGSLFCLVPKKTQSGYLPTSYGVSEGVAGVGASSLGCCTNFFDEGVFLSERGLEGVSPGGVTSGKTLRKRSDMISLLLCKKSTEEYENASMCVWEGYLALLIGSDIFLADTRSGGYEWFWLKDIVSYTGDHSVFRKRSSRPEGLLPDKSEYFISKDENIVPHDSVRSCEISAGVFVYYVTEGGRKYLVDDCSERDGGTEHAAKSLFSDGKLLFFGCDNGDLCLFNNDKRGKISADDDTGESEINRIYYNRCNHAYLSGFATASDSMGLPNKVKKAKGSCVIKAKAIIGSSFRVKIRTERDDWKEYEKASGSEVSALGTDFSSFSFSPSKSFYFFVNEERMKFIEKQYYLYSDEYERPFGVYSIGCEAAAVK